MKNVQYDPAIIRDLTDKVFALARTIISICTTIGVIAGFFIGQLLAPHELKIHYVAAGMIIAGLLGYSIGRVPAFILKLAAQSVLCQVQVEENTREAQKEISQSVTK